MPILNHCIVLFPAPVSGAAEQVHVTMYSGWGQHLSGTAYSYVPEWKMHGTVTVPNNDFQPSSGTPRECVYNARCSAASSADI